MKMKLENQQLNMYCKGDLVGAIYSTEPLEVELERLAYPTEEWIKVKLSLFGGIAYSFYYVNKVTLLIDDERKEVEVNL